jgi:D-alanyl-lipoteichoic acid acyltransferase DltB (MBOAT superfamily)
MDSSAALDLFAAPFWCAVALACVLMIPLAAGRARQIAFAAVNLGFLWYLRRSELAIVLIGLLVVYLLLRLLAAGKHKLLLGSAAGAALLALFLAHKLPELIADPSFKRGNALMTAIGFSYVALRLIDLGRAVAEGRHRAPDLIALINYLLPFHMLAAGPIQSYDEFVAQPQSPPAPGPAMALKSVERIVLGMFKKFVLANALQAAFLTFFQARGPYFFIEVQLNYIWLFLDFSAYSDIAVGIGGLIGVATPENFNRPYIARNSIDFWDRWHMSLSQFIRRNLFFPIQVALVRSTGGRHTLLIASFAFVVSFLLCGLWHGIGLNWLAWGACQAIGLITCNLYREFLLKKLGRKGLSRYLANPWIRVVAMLITFEFIAWTMVLQVPAVASSLRSASSQAAELAE